jgi:hypothetical protein
VACVWKQAGSHDQTANLLCVIVGDDHHDCDEKKSHSVNDWFNEKPISREFADSVSEKWQWWFSGLFWSDYETWLEGMSKGIDEWKRERKESLVGFASNMTKSSWGDANERRQIMSHYGHMLHGQHLTVHIDHNRPGWFQTWDYKTGRQKPEPVPFIEVLTIKITYYLNVCALFSTAAQELSLIL